MGTKKSKKRSRDDSDDSSAEEDKKARKKEKKGKKDKKAEKEEKEKLKLAKKFLKKKLKEEKASIPEEDLPLESDAQIDNISSESYFMRNPEFTAWLRDEKGKFFNDLPSVEARKLFEDFIIDWNSRKLKRKYYRGGISAADARRTHHSWGIQGGGVGDAKLGMAAALEEEREAREGARDRERAEVRRWKADQKAELEEMLPQATGREALIEKRMARREDARARDASPDLATIPGGGDMYGGDDSFAAARNREANRGQHQARRNALRGEVAKAKVREAEAKEEQSMARFRALIADGPIQIQKRL